MTKRILLLALALLIPALGSAQSMLLVDKYMAAWNAHDAAAAAEFYDDGVSYYDASTGTPVIGKLKAQTGIVQAFLTAVPDLAWTRDTDEPIVGTDAVSFTWTFSGTNTGLWSDGTKPTNKKFLIHGATLIHLKHGKIVAQGDYYDAHTFYKQLGLNP
ncbi:MAG: ester cyclase [Elusimicrobiota bacterium]